MRTRLLQRQALHQPVQLPDLYSQYVFRSIRPDESALLKALVPQTESIAVPVKHLHHVTLPVAECEQMPGERIKLQIIRNQHGQTIDRLPQVSYSSGYVYIYSRELREHGYLSKTLMTFLRTASSNSPSSSMVNCFPHLIRIGD